MSRSLNDLTPVLREWSFELIARCAEQQIMLLVVDTLRTPEEQAANVAKGVSWTLASKHLPQADGLSWAIDVCPFDTYMLVGPDKLAWNANLPVWGKIVAIAKVVAASRKIRIICGADWTKRDVGHFELAEIIIGAPGTQST